MFHRSDEDAYVAGKWLLSTPVVALPCTFGNSIQHCSVIIIKHNFLLTMTARIKFNWVQPSKLSNSSQNQICTRDFLSRTEHLLFDCEQHPWKKAIQWADARLVYIFQRSRRARLHH